MNMDAAESRVLKWRPNVREQLNQIAAHFAELPWPRAVRLQSNRVEIDHEWFGTTCVSVASLVGSGPTFIYDTVYAEPATPERRQAVAHFMARVNFELVVGAFSLDWGHGTVRCRSAADIAGQPLTNAFLSGVVHPHHQAMNTYFTHLRAVVRGEMEPDEAFAEAFEQLG